MFCGMISKKKKKSGSVPVYLNVYDLVGFTPVNGYAYWLGLGVYHSGVQVHGVEYAFEGHEDDTTGVFKVEPKQCLDYTFRKAILIGRTDLGVEEVGALVEKLSKDYVGSTYNLMNKNCNHFSKDFCKLLTGKRIPSWVNRLARLGRLCQCALPVQPIVKDEAKIHPTSGENRLAMAEKRETDSTLSLINLARKSIAFEDVVDSRVLKYGCKVQHEILNLAEEKRSVHLTMWSNQEGKQLAADTWRQQEYLLSTLLLIF